MTRFDCLTNGIYWIFVVRWIDKKNKALNEKVVLLQNEHSIFMLQSSNSSSLDLSCGGGFTLWGCLFFLQHSGPRILSQIVMGRWTRLGSPQLRSCLRTKWCIGKASYNTNKLTNKDICIEWQQKQQRKCKAVKKILEQNND